MIGRHPCSSFGSLARGLLRASSSSCRVKALGFSDCLLAVVRHTRVRRVALSSERRAFLVIAYRNHHAVTVQKSQWR